MERCTDEDRIARIVERDPAARARPGDRVSASGAVGGPAEVRADWGVVDVRALLTAFGAAPTRARATIVVQGAGRRMARALAGLGACWGPAVVSIFVPVAHFVLVPTFTRSSATRGGRNSACTAATAIPSATANARRSPWRRARTGGIHLGRHDPTREPAPSRLTIVAEARRGRG